MNEQEIGNISWRRGARASSKGKSIKARHGRDQRKHMIEGTGESGHGQTRKRLLHLGAKLRS